jgi:hypothetical protein
MGLLQNILRRRNSLPNRLRGYFQGVHDDRTQNNHRREMATHREPDVEPTRAGRQAWEHMWRYLLPGLTQPAQHGHPFKIIWRSRTPVR